MSRYLSLASFAVRLWIIFLFLSITKRLFLCQIDVFNAFIDLLRQTGNVTKGSGGLANPSRCLSISFFTQYSVFYYDFKNKSFFNCASSSISFLFQLCVSLPFKSLGKIDVNCSTMRVCQDVEIDFIWIVVARYMFCSRKFRRLSSHSISSFVKNL